MRRFFRKSKGAISVFMAIIYMWVFILEALLVDGGRLRLAEAEAEEAQQLANESAMTLFNDGLYQYYDLFGETKYTTDEMKGIVKDLMTTQLGVSSDSSALGKEEKNSVVSGVQGSDYFDPFHFEVSINEVGNIGTLADEDIFKSQISDSMKYKGPIYLAENFLDILGQTESMKDMNDAVQNATNTIKPVYTAYGTYRDHAQTVQEHIEQFCAHPADESHGNDLNPYAKEMEDKITLQLAGGCQSIQSLTDSIIDYRIQIYELENPEADDESSEDEEEDNDGAADTSAQYKAITELQKEKDKAVEDTISDVEAQIDEYIATLRKIETNIGSEASSGLLKELKDLEDEAESLRSEKIAPASGSLRSAKGSVSSDYAAEIDETYDGFNSNLSKLDTENVNPSVDNNRKYREALNEIKNASPSVDEVEDYLKNEYLPACKKMLNKFRSDSADYEEITDVLDEDSDAEEKKEYADSDKYEIRDNKYVIEIQNGDGYSVGKAFYQSGNKVDQYNTIVKNKTNQMRSGFTKITSTLSYDESVAENAGKDFDPNSGSSDLASADSSGTASALEALGSDSQEALTTVLNGHKLGSISGHSVENYTADKYGVTQSKNAEDSVAARNDMMDSMTNAIGDALKGGTDSLFECAYVMSYFRDFVHTGRMKQEHLNDDKYDTVINTKFIRDDSKVSYLTDKEFKQLEVSCAEAEYVLYGMSDTKNDVAAAYAEIFAMRLLTDYVSVWLTTELRQSVLDAAAAAGPFAPLVIAAMPLVFATPRALADMTVIMNAKKCPLLFRDKADWLKMEWSSKDNKKKALIGYGDYLLMFLLVDFGDSKTGRMQDVIETNMKKVDSSFALNKALVNLYVDSECSINYLFMSQSFIPQKWRRDSRHKFKLSTNFSY